jgi:hypothetical protein
MKSYVLYYALPIHHIALLSKSTPTSKSTSIPYYKFPIFCLHPIPIHYTKSLSIPYYKFSRLYPYYLPTYYYHYTRPYFKLDYVNTSRVYLSSCSNNLSSNYYIDEYFGICSSFGVNYISAISYQCSRVYSNIY